MKGRAGGRAGGRTLHRSFYLTYLTGNGVLSGPLYGRCVTDLIIRPLICLGFLFFALRFFSSYYAMIMSSISGIVSFVGILLAASSSAFSVSDVKTIFGGQKIFTYRVYMMEMTVGRFLWTKSSLRSYSYSICHSGGIV